MHRLRSDGSAAGWLAVAASFAVIFGVWNAYAGFGVFLSVLSEEFGWSRGAISGVASLSLIVGGVLGFHVGAAFDRYGPRRILATGAILVGVAFLLSATMGALWHFYLLQGLVVGLGMAVMYLVPTATVSRWFQRQRGLALGIVLSANSLAFMSGAPLATLLIETVGWRGAYLILGGLVLLVVPLAALVKAPPAEVAPQVTPGKEVAGLAGGGRFTIWKAARDRRIWVLQGAWLFLGFAYMMVSIHLVPFAEDLGNSLARASLALTLYGVGQMAGRVALGGAADRLGTQTIFWFSVGLEFASLLLLLTGPPTAALYLLALAFGLGTAGTDTASIKTVAEVFGTRSIGAVIGLLSLGWRSGAALGPALAGYVYDATGLYTIAFALALGGLAGSVALYTLAIGPALQRARPPLLAVPRDPPGRGEE